MKFLFGINKKNRDEEDTSDHDVAHKLKKGKLRHKISDNIRFVLSAGVLGDPRFHQKVPYILFITLLAIIYISFGFKMQQQYRKYDAINSEVKELRTKSMTLSSNVMKATRQSELLRKIKERGLKIDESLTVPYVIEN